MSQIKNSVTDQVTTKQSQPSKVQRLKGGQIGVFDLVVFVIACAAPMLIAAGVMPAVFSTGGAGAPSMYIFAGVIYGFSIVGYVAMARHIEDPGAFYAFVSEGVGERAGSTVGMVTLVAYLTIALTEIIACGAFGQAAIQYITGVSVPWVAISFVSAIIVAGLAYRQINLSAKVLGVALVLEMLALIIFAIVVFIAGGAHGITGTSFTPQAVMKPGIGIAMLFAFASFFGVEATAIYAEEAKDPVKTVPRATYLAVAILTVFYTVISWAIVVAFGDDNIASIATKHTDQMFFMASSRYVGSYMTAATHVLLYTSTFATALAFFNQANRYMLSLGRAKVIPPVIAEMHKEHNTPHIATLIQFALAIILIVIVAALDWNPYTAFLVIAGTGVIGVIFSQFSASCSVLFYFQRNRWPDTTLFHRVIAPVIGTIGLGYALILMLSNVGILTGSGTKTNIILFIPMVLAAIMGFINPGRGIRKYYDEDK